jgi:hypothetical protein
MTTIWLGSTPVPGLVSGLTSPDAIVLATAVPVRAPTKLAVADSTMAYSGLRARVDTDEGPGRNRRRDGIGRVVEPIDVVERDREDEDRDEGD